NTPLPFSATDCRGKTWSLSQGASATGYTRPSTSPASAGFFFVEKKGGGLRPCIVYWGPNQCSVKYCYPLPLVPAALEQLRSATIFTKLDLCSAYNLVCIRVDDEWKMAFSTTSGHYEYLVIVYGLSSTPSVFQCFINDVLKDLLGRSVIIYIDDILIYSSSPGEHVCQVHQVLQRLLQHQLYVKAEKCEIHQHTISFLGYISPEGISMDKGKVHAVVEWLTPQTVRDLQRFLGFANSYASMLYQRFQFHCSHFNIPAEGRPNDCPGIQPPKQHYINSRKPSPQLPSESTWTLPSPLL
ncbi:hypothetical protein AMELA_G00186400, partial [Ameiurus melas]